MNFQLIEDLTKLLARMAADCSREVGPMGVEAHLHSPVGLSVQLELSNTIGKQHV